VFIIGEPRHGNIGDSAIAEAEKKFIYDTFDGNCKIADVFVDDYKYDIGMWDKLIQKKDIICMHGGGNMGDLWYEEELFREDVIKRFPDNRIIIFPQTMMFSSKEKLENSKLVYDTHKHLTMVARDQVTYDSMKEAFPNCDVILTPDIVLSLGNTLAEYDGSDRKNIGLFMRRDVERALNDESMKILLDYLNSKGYSYDELDMVDPVSITIENRLGLIKDKLKKISGYRLVITDRLHAMVFSTLTGTPCIVFGNNHHKVKGCYEWIKNLKHIQLVASMDEAIALIDSFYNDDTKREMIDLSEKYEPLRKALLKR
jgi:pyruvyl transferase EpsI